MTVCPLILYTIAVKELGQQGFALLLLILLIGITGTMSVFGYKAIKNKYTQNKASNTPSLQTSPNTSTTPSIIPSSATTNSSSAITKNSKTTPPPQQSTAPTSVQPNTPRPSSSPAQSTGQSSVAGSPIFFDKSESVVTVLKGQNSLNNGWSAPAFNLQGKGSKGFTLTSSGFPSGISVIPYWGTFADDKGMSISAWVSNIITYGTYSGTVTLKTNLGDSSATQTIPLTIKYQQPTPDNPMTSCSIRLLYPNGGEIFKVGDKVKIAWEPNNLTNLVEIMLKDQLGTLTWINFSAPNTASYSYDWVVNKGNTANTQFVVTLRFPGCSTADQSDNYFTINP